MELIKVELTFEEIEMLIHAMKNTATIAGTADITATPAFKKLLSRLQTIDNAHTVMSVAATYDDNPNKVDLMELIRELEAEPDEDSDDDE